MGLVRIGKKWPRKTIYYQISMKVLQLDTQGNIQFALDVWARRTSLKFVMMPAPNRILFVFSLESMATGRCSSAVGMKGGLQKIRCAPPFSKSALIHEIGHAIGLYHEHQRPDRDKAVTPWPFSRTADFGKKKPPKAIPVGRYDCRSIMHYPARSFQNVKSGGCANNTTRGMGQRNGPTRSDFAAVKYLYG